MQECDIMLRLAGSVLHVVPKQKVTPAEILVLRAIHGPDAVQDVTPTKLNRRDRRAEYDRLVAEYAGGSAMAPDAAAAGGGPNIVAQLFPGANPNIPVTLEDIGLGDALKGKSEVA